MSKTKQKSAQEIQDDIFRKMSPDRKLRYASDFSMFLIELNKLGKYDGLSRTNRQDSKNSRGS